MDGATALAIPTKLGQRMVVKNTKSTDLSWKSYDQKGDEWFNAQVSLYDFSSEKTSDTEAAKTLGKLLKNACRLNSEFLNNWRAYKVETFLEFDRNWGLGSSSTLTHLVAQWADVNPFLLHFRTFEGSGYDVACAGADSPILYEFTGENLHYEEVDWHPSFLKNVYFVYLNEKQSTQEAVSEYQKKPKPAKKIIQQISDITEKVIDTKSFDAFQNLMKEHNEITSKILGKKTIQQEQFEDFDGVVKSLGAWGGDFVMAASNLSESDTKAYFTEKGFDQVVPYADMAYVE